MDHEARRLEGKPGRYIFIVDATLVSQSGTKTQNTHSTGNRQRRPRQGRRYHQKKVVRKTCHRLTFGLLFTPSGMRIPFQIPYHTKEYCQQKNIPHRTTAESAADLILGLPLPEGADVVVLGDTAYDAKVVQQACRERGDLWIVPANPERVYEGPSGHRPKVRARLKDWTSLSLTTIRWQASTGKYAEYRRLSQWRVGPKQKPRVYYVHQERSNVRRVGDVQFVCSTTKQNLSKAAPDDVKILMTNALRMSPREVVELYSLRWQIDLFFNELKSTLGFAQYRFQNFEAVRAWAEITRRTVLFLEQHRAHHLADRRLSDDRREWWKPTRLHGLCHAFRQECAGRELKYLSDRLKTTGGIEKLKRQLQAPLAQEFRHAR